MTEPINDGVLEHVDPRVLELEINVRPEQALTKQFIASIKENGVLVPIVAIRDTDGTLRVRAGARRTMAAREAGLATVPVYVTNAGADTATRVVQQITENDHRLALRPDERVLGIQTLLDTGMSATKVAKKLAVSMERVKQSKAVASSQTALDALAEGTLTLAEAAGLAEFEGDEQAQRSLVRARGQFFDHELSRQRRIREDAKAWEVAAQGYRDQGFEVLTERPESFSTEYVPRWAFGDEPVEVADPKHWAVEIAEETVCTLKDTGQRVDEDDVDWSTEGDPEATPAEDMYHADQIEETTGFTAVEYYCRDLEAAGLTPNDRYLRLSSQGGGGQAQETRDDLAAQKEKRERRKVIALNKAGEAAEAVRRDFVRTMLSRKNPPKGAAVFVARMLAADGYLLTNFKADETIADLLGVGPTVRSGVQDLINEHTTDGRAQVLTLGLVLGALEGRTPKHAWRHNDGHYVGPKEYLGFLADNGYTLSDIEEVMAGHKDADQVCDAEVKG